MRPIKFRAFANFKDNPMMIFKDLDDKNWYSSTHADAKLICVSSTNDCRRFTVMQFTGVKDKYEVEIYEGDILKGKYGELHTVSSDDAIEGGMGTFHTGFCFGGVDYTDIDSVEVIGNIYENKELIK